MASREHPKCEPDERKASFAVEERYCEKFRRDGSDDSSWSSINSEIRDQLLVERPHERTSSSAFTWSNQSWREDQRRTLQVERFRKWAAHFPDSEGFKPTTQPEKSQPMESVPKRPRSHGRGHLPMEHTPPDTSNDDKHAPGMSTDPDHGSRSTGGTGSTSSNDRVEPADLAFQNKGFRGKFSL